MKIDGGKNGEGVWHAIINQMPPHKVYIEACLGSGAIIRRKRPAQYNYGIEKDPITFAAAKPSLTARPGAGLFLRHGDCFDLVPHLILSVYRDHPAHEKLIYFDPPYLKETRSQQRDLYRCEWGIDDHVRLLKLVTQLPAMVMLSGYYSKMYEHYLPPPVWRSVQFQATTRAGQRTEWLWCNFPEPVELHDYSCLGTDRTERQRIKRKKERWKAKLEKMPMLERHAVLAAIQEWRHDRPEKSEMTTGPAPKSELTAGAGNRSQLQLRSSAGGL